MSFEVSNFFKEILTKEPELAPAVGAVNALTKVIENSKGNLNLIFTDFVSKYNDGT
jgi:hypothetical protein